MELHYEDNLKNEKTPLLLVHGLFSSRNHWNPNIELEDDFRIINVDLPGHGLSPSPEDKKCYLPEEIVVSLDRIRDQLGIQSWAICGQSFGAALTMRYALTYPDKVIANIFTNANGAFRGAWTRDFRTRHNERLEKIRCEGQAGMLALPYHPVHAHRFPKNIHDTLCADASLIPTHAMVNIFETTMPRLSVRNDMKRLKPPTLLINGKWERAFQDTRKWLEDNYPNIEIVDLEGGHSINIEQPVAFNKALKKFIFQHIQENA